MDMLKRLVEAVMFLMVELLVIFRSKFAFVFAPDRHHAVHMLLFLIVLEFALAAFFESLARDVHFNRITDEI
ncbi:hypothetical protein D3C71_2050760 [compost metagenome]